MGIKKSFLILCWALYDLANQFFALNVVSLYFVLWITKERGVPELFYSLAFGISMFLVAVLSPVLGAISDITCRHKLFLVWCTMIAVVFTILLRFTQNIFVALVLFAIANFGCQMGVLFYNALMTRVSPKGKMGLVSGLGRMCGYIGAILALYFTRPVILAKGYQATFVITGLSAEFLIKDVLSEIGIEEIEYYEDLTQIPDHISSSAYAVAGAFYNERNSKV